LDYEEAGAALRIKPDWLRDNIAKLPHQKFGQNAAVFCHCDLRLIQAMNTRLPKEARKVLDPAAEAAAPIPTATSAVRSLASAKPARGRARRAATPV
jgi:hypothetical protein